MNPFLAFGLFYAGMALGWILCALMSANGREKP